jgi:tRNA threonylcarbamoyladenosine modification (KEOPS) complex  Pcc1 subunit
MLVLKTKHELSRKEPLPTVRSARLEVTISVKDPLLIESIKTALLPEIKSGQQRRCKVRMKSDPRGSLVLLFASNDLVSLRAALNSLLRLAAATMQVVRGLARAQENLSSLSCEGQERTTLAEDES